MNTTAAPAPGDAKKVGPRAITYAWAALCAITIGFMVAGAGTLHQYGNA